MDRRTLPVAQLDVTGGEVRVKVGQEDVADPAAHAPRGLQRAADVALRIDDGRHAAALVGDEIPRVRKTAEIVLLEDHARPLEPSSKLPERSDDEGRHDRTDKLGCGTILM
jgi:hypothetical protein